jgi:Protein of unknown function (DUF3108)
VTLRINAFDFSVFCPRPAAAGLLVGAAALLLAAAPGTVRADPLNASYQVFFGGLHVLDAEANWERGLESYRISGKAQSQGFIGWLYPWHGTTESRGLIAAGKVIPQSHENRGTNSEGDKLVLLTYGPEGDIADTLVQPEPEWEERHPLPADAGRGTLDPLSVIAGLSELLEKNGRCEGSFPVFDGKRRYDLTVSDSGTADLEATDYSIFAGEARACRLDYQLLGGHRIERSKYAATARERIVWVGRPSKDAPLIPVRLQIDTAYGTVMGHLTGFAQGPQVAETPDQKLTD